MIFLITQVELEFDVCIYESLDDLTSRVEWQDIFGGRSIVIDEKGTIYQWDSSRSDEFASLYGYTIIPINSKWEFAGKCLAKYFDLGKPSEYRLKIDE